MVDTRSAPGVREKVNFSPENLLGRKLADLSFQHLILVCFLRFLFCFQRRTFTFMLHFFIGHFLSILPRLLFYLLQFGFGLFTCPTSTQTICFDSLSSEVFYLLKLACRTDTLIQFLVHVTGWQLSATNYQICTPNLQWLTH